MWIDGQRPIFTVNFQLMSTVVTADQHLHNLFAHTDRMLEQRATSPPPSETEICKILKVWGYIWYRRNLRRSRCKQNSWSLPWILLFSCWEEFSTQMQSLCVCACVRARALWGQRFSSVLCLYLLAYRLLFVHTVYSLEWDMHLTLLLNGRCWVWGYWHVNTVVDC